MKRLYIGIDGGGTKTMGVLADETGAVQATCGDGASAIVGVPGPEDCAVLRSMVGRLCEAVGVPLSSIAGLGLGLNGIDFPAETVQQHAALARELDVRPERLILVNDGIVALWGATPAEAAAILQHGTAFTAAYRSAYGNEQSFDHLDAGRLYDLRSGALALVARMIDGRAAVSPLKEAILAALGNPPEDDYAEMVFRHSITATQLAGLLPVVWGVAEAGDPATIALVDHAMADYVCTAVAMLRKTGTVTAEIAFGGGRMTTAPAWFWQRLAEGVRKEFPGAAVRRPALSPAAGAAIMAAHADGCPPSRFFAKEQVT